MKTDRENLYNLFEVAMDFVISSGGDGTALIICDGYLGIADIFEKWLKSSVYRNFNRKNYLEQQTTIFCGEGTEEGVVFKNIFEPNDYDAYEFVTILPSWYLEFVK